MVAGAAGSLRRFLWLAWAAAEVLLLWWLGSTLGWGWVLLALILGVVAAVAVLAATMANFREGLAGLRGGQRFTTIDPVTGATTTVLGPAPGNDAGQQAAFLQRQVRQAGVLLTAAALFAVPGLISDAAALVLLLPPVRRRLAQARTAPGSFTVVPGQTIHPPGARTDDPVPRADGPAVVPGQILPLERPETFESGEPGEDMGRHKC